MSNGNHFYNESIKFYNAVFMELFNDVYVKRQSKYIKVPIEFSDKRQENILKSVSSLQKEISQHSLIYEFYFKRHKKFSEISPNEELAE